MKTCEIVTNQLNTDYTGRILPYLKRYFIGISFWGTFLLSSFIHLPVAAQILIPNSSLEGTPKEGTVPPSWYLCGRSPDVQPGCCNVSLLPSDGTTYVGMLCDSAFDEGIATKLSSMIEGGKTYALSFDLASPTVYYNQTISRSGIIIYGGNSACDQSEVLWKSAPFDHKSWKKYNATFTPAKSYKYISFRPYYLQPAADACVNCRMSGVFIDNISPEILEAPRIEIITRNTCKDDNTGAATVKVEGSNAPYKYSWEPGDYKESSISRLKSGQYEVTVTAANGAVSKGLANIKENDINIVTSIVNPFCYKDKTANINIDVKGGVSPYEYSIDNGITFSGTPVFKDLYAGIYNVMVKDAFNCVVKVPDVIINQPDLLQLTAEKVKSISCSDLQYGQIALTANGGTPPYTYSIPGYKFQKDSVLQQLEAGHYQYRVTDSHDCSIEGDATITKDWRDCAVFIPNAFSPNGDGVNDFFRVVAHDDLTQYSLTVYSRWGQLIFESHDPERGWDGGLKGSVLPSGTYLYIVTYTDSKKQARKHTGSLVLMR
jgi:gliding motility-associated-like protein